MGGTREGNGEGTDPRPTERRNPRTTGIDRASPREIVDLILDEERRVPDAVVAERDAIAELVSACVERLDAGGRLIYLGAGTSGRLGTLDAVECPPTFGTDPRIVQAIVAGGREALVRSVEGAEDDADAARTAVREAGVGPDDLVLGIATSGTTPFVVAGLEEAADRGAATGFLSCSRPPERVRRTADVLVTPLVGPEVIAGSTRMKAGTATKLVLNALTTATMVRLGKVYENLMVDLRAVSRKLVDRSVRIVVEVGRIPESEARRLLMGCGGSAKTAIAMARLQTSRAAAERALDACGGFLADALERFGGAPVPRYACYPEREDASARRAVLAALAGVGEPLEEGLRARRSPAEDAALIHPPSGWGPAQHLAHLLEFERVVGERAAAYRTGAPSGFDGWTSSRQPRGADRPPDEILALFMAERGRTVAALPPPDGEAWDRRVRIGGEVPTLYQFLRGVAQHDRAHAARIRERVHRDLLAPSDDGDGR